MASTGIFSLNSGTKSNHYVPEEANRRDMILFHILFDLQHPLKLCNVDACFVLSRNPSKRTTSLQRRCNIVTLQRRCNDVVVKLCVYWDSAFSEFTAFVFKDCDSLVVVITTKRKRAFGACTDSGLDRTARMRSMNRVFAVR